MRITDPKLIAEVLDARTKLLHKYRDDYLLTDPNARQNLNMFCELCRCKISRKQYPEIKKDMKNNHNIDGIIFNQGGDQSRKIAEYEANGQDYIHITEDLMTLSEDLKSF